MQAIQKRISETFGPLIFWNIRYFFRPVRPESSESPLSTLLLTASSHFSHPRSKRKVRKEGSKWDIPYKGDGKLFCLITMINFFNLMILERKKKNRQSTGRV